MCKGLHFYQKNNDTDPKFNYRESYSSKYQRLYHFREKLS